MNTVLSVVRGQWSVVDRACASPDLMTLQLTTDNGQRT